MSVKLEFEDSFTQSAYFKEGIKVGYELFESTNLRKHINDDSNAGHTITFKMLAPAMFQNVPDVLGRILLLRIVLVVLFPSVLTVVKIMLLIVRPAQYLRSLCCAPPFCNDFGVFINIV
jgi:hypothetical protein